MIDLIDAVGVHNSLRDLGLQDCLTHQSAASIFDRQNPTGRYKLDLARPEDRSIFEELRDEAAPGGENILNARLDGKVITEEAPPPEFRGR